MRRLAAAVSLGLFAFAPQDDAGLFDPARTSLDPGAAAAVASDLVEYAQRQAAQIPEYPVLGEYRQLVRIAFLLAPSEPGVAAAHRRIRNGEPPEAARRDVPRDGLMKSLMGLVSVAKGGKRKDDLAAARALAAVGVLIDPRHEACQTELQALSRRLGEMPWDRALSVYRRAIPDGFTSSINGLLVLSAGGPAQVGAVSRIVLAYRAGPTNLEVHLLREDADQTQTSAEEAVRYWKRVRQRPLLPSGSLEISFEDKFTKKDGPSAGAAFAVLLRSFSDPFTVDPAFAMTGDVSVDGRILQVGGVFPKIRGALMGGCARVGVPALDEAELTDAVLLGGPMTLAEIEVLGLGTIEEAVAAARADRDARSKQASADFAALKPLVEKKLKGNDPATTAAIQKLTSSILASSPRHLSARLIDAWNLGKLPSTLTLGASLDRSYDLLLGYLEVIRTKKELDFADIETETKTGNVSEVLKKLREMTPRLHADAQKPAAKLEKAFLTIRKFIEGRAPLDSKKKRMNDSEKIIEELKKKIEKAKSDKRPQDHIDGLTKRHNEEVATYNAALAAHAKAVEDRTKIYNQVIEVYNEYVVMIRQLTQDPRLLEKLMHGK